MAKTVPLDYENLNVLYLMHLLGYKLRACFSDISDKYSLTLQQGNMLIFITKRHLNNEVVHQQDLEQYYLLNKSTISGMIDRLEERGLIKRKLNGRFANIVPTKEGITIADGLRALVSQYDFDSLSVLTEEEQVVFRQSIIKLLRHIDSMKEEGKYVE